MRKQIKQLGGSKGITFTQQDMDGYGLKLGDWIDIEIYKESTEKELKEIGEVLDEN